MTENIPQEQLREAFGIDIGKMERKMDQRFGELIDQIKKVQEILLVINKNLESIDRSIVGP